MNRLIRRTRNNLILPHNSKFIRTLFSKTGEWPKEFTEEVRNDLETYWKPLIKTQDKKTKKLTENGQKEKFYVLSMFPYPSGKLHMGHVRVYTISDAMARFHRASGKAVIHPMGWDAFGLPAENAAIDRGKLPEEWTYSNIAVMQKQLQDMCYSFDYDRGFATCDPEYYKWTQFLFLKFYEHGLAYQKEGAVNWDPVDQTVLADEQIDEHGCSWRSGAKVQRKFLKQWYFKTSAYAKALVDGLDELDADLWRDVISLQRQWIGTIDGVRFEFQLFQGRHPVNHYFSVFTREPHAFYGASHILISPNHFLNQEQYYEKEEDEHTIKLNLSALNFLRGNKIPIYVHKTHDFGEFLDSYLAIPCLNPEDEYFASRPYRNLNYTNVIHDSGLVANSGKFSNTTKEEAGEAIAKQARKFKKGGYWTSEKNRDWCISRQRYWGTPIPMMHCTAPGGGPVPVPYEQLPVMLPPVADFRGKEGKSPLASADESWLYGWCPKVNQCPCDSGECCGRPLRETDTMDTFVDSSWYFLRYLSPKFNQGPFNPEDTHEHMPVDLYIGGKEHAIMHLYYARFFCHFLHDLGWLPTREPFQNLLTQGMVRGQAFRVTDTGKYVPREQVDFSGAEPVEKSTGAALSVTWEKMSKSKHNGVDPQQVLDKYGVEATRLCILAGVAPKSDRNWDEQIFIGIRNWQEKIWQFVTTFREQTTGEQSASQEINPALVKKYNEELYDSRNYFLKEVNYHLKKSFLISTAISRLQGLTNSLRKVPPHYIAHCDQYERALNDLVVMISIFAPMFGAELRKGLGKDPSVEDQWPVVDKDYKIKLKVRVNLKAVLELPLDVSLHEIESLRREDVLEHAQKHPDWAKVFGNHLIDHTFLEVIPEMRAELHVASSSLEKERKQKKKQRKQQAAQESGEEEGSIGDANNT